MIDAKFCLFSRRQMLRQILGSGLGLRLLGSPLLELSPTLSLAQASSTPNSFNMPTLSAEDDKFLNDIQTANFLFFWEQGSPNTGMIKDRCTFITPTTKQSHQVLPRPVLALPLCALAIAGVSFRPAPHWRGSSRLCGFCGRSSQITAAFITTSPTKKPESECGTPRFHPSTRRFCSAAS